MIDTATVNTATFLQLHIYTAIAQFFFNIKIINEYSDGVYSALKTALAGSGENTAERVDFGQLGANQTCIPENIPEYVPEGEASMSEFFGFSRFFGF